jgi:hypothetical protein
MALLEIDRVLKPGGFHIFTTPKFDSLAVSSQRARLHPWGEIEYLHSPEYHGNPVGDGKALVTWLFGRDFDFLLAAWTGRPITVYQTRDRSLGLDAMYNHVFVASKPL